MEEKYMAVLYEKNELSENLYCFKRIGVITNGYINLYDDFNELTYYEDGKKVTVQSIECPNFIISDEKYCYGYALSHSDLKKTYGDDLEIGKLACKYLDDISSVLNIGYYNPETDTVKLLVSNEEVLKKIEDEDKLFSNFEVMYDSIDEQKVSFSIRDLEKIFSYVKEKKYDFLEIELQKLINNINESNKYINERFGIKVQQIEEKKEESSTLDDTMMKLNNLIGLENIKKEIMKLKKYLIFREKVEKSLKLDDPNLHMFFTGNPGTGKTTVARIIGELYYNMGYIKNNKFAEITPRELIAGYVGQTAIKTANFLKKNKGGVIFIDEAYVLSSDAQEFADEALVEILKELEKKETAFIFAGYEDEMSNFIKMNPGLASRIGYYLRYEDYTKEELLEIFNKKATEMGFIVEEELKNKISKIIEIEKENKNFGNGRYIDKLLEKIILEHSINTELSTDKNELITLKEIDLNEEVIKSLIFKQKSKKLGF